jgi:hypothetical protein
VAITSACQSKYASSNHIGFLNADASRAGKLCGGVPIELEVGCEPLPVKPDVGCEEPEEEMEAEGELDELDPPADEPPPPFKAPPDVFFMPECRPLGQEAGEEKEEERLRFGRAPAGTASEFKNTSPRMCSTYWAGTPDCCTGWVNTTCKPVAVTVASLELVVSVVVPVPSPELVVVVVPV